jgi:transcriptional regulator with XRE-family HTH domain
MEFGIKERFVIIRQKIGLNTKQFATSLNMASTTVSSIESGKREPSKEVLVKLSVTYKVNLHWMLTGEGEMFLEGQNAVENSEQDEKTAKIAELEEKIKALENQEARVLSLEAENKELEAENRQLSEDLLEMVRKFVIAPKAAKA